MYSTQDTGDPYPNIFAAVIRQAIKDVTANNDHAEDAAAFLSEHETARKVIELARKVGTRQV